MIKAGEALILSKKEVIQLNKSLNALDWQMSDNLNRLKLYDFVFELSKKLREILKDKY